VFALLIAAVGSGVRYQRALAAERASAQAAENARWLGQGQKNPHSAAHYGLYAFKPASPLTAIDQGIEPFVGVSVRLEAHTMNDFMHRPAQDGTALARFGELTAALTLQVLLPLLIVLFAFGAFSAERERGTLRQLLASYAHDDATITKDTNVNLIGKRVVNVPRDTASFWSTNELQTGDLAGLKFGGGLLQTDNRLVNNANLFFLPGYVRYDAVVSYRLKSWRVALNIQNLTDKKYFDSAGGVFHPMAPRQFFLNLAYTF